MSKSFVHDALNLFMYSVSPYLYSGRDDPVKRTYSLRPNVICKNDNSFRDTECILIFRSLRKILTSLAIDERAARINNVLSTQWQFTRNGGWWWWYSQGCRD